MAMKNANRFTIRVLCYTVKINFLFYSNSLALVCLALLALECLLVCILLVYKLAIQNKDVLDVYYSA